MLSAICLKLTLAVSSLPIELIALFDSVAMFTCKLKGYTYGNYIGDWLTPYANLVNYSKKGYKITYILKKLCHFY